MRVLIIGGVAGGASAAARLRRLDETAEITVYERGTYVSFANCGLPYHLSGMIPEREQLLLQTPEGFRQRFAIDVRVGHEVTAIHRETKELEVRRLETGEVFRDRYDRLILAPGARPIVPPLPGLELPAVFTLRDIPDLDRIMATLAGGARRAVVVGGGYIGVEVAENFVHRGLEVDLLEMQDQLLGFLDRDMAAWPLAEMQTGGVRVHLGTAIAGVSEASGGGLAVHCGDGVTRPADLVVLGIGVQPETELARAAGLSLGETGAIRVSSSMQTSDPTIYAVGDAVEVIHAITGLPSRIPLAGPANRQGRLAADHICGIERSFGQVQATAIIKVFTMTCGSTGANSLQLERAGIPFRVAVTHAGNHAGYYPGATQIHLKLLYAPGDGRLLGAQACGHEGVDKRIDVLATAIRHGATVHDLTEYELAYAPPYGSAKDPVNMLGFIAVNDLEGLAPQLEARQLPAQLAKGALLVDVRNPDETAAGIIPGARVIPLSLLRDRLEELPRGRTLIPYCQIGLRGYIAQRILKQNGFTALNLSGGYLSWQAWQEKARAGAAAADDHQTRHCAGRQDAGH